MKAWMAWMVLAGGLVVGCQGDAEDPPARRAHSGVVVEEVGQGSVLAKAGLQVGDVLLSWHRPSAAPAHPEDARGELPSAFEWRWLTVEQAPRGEVRLTGQRGTEARVFEVAKGKWDGKVLPAMPPAMLSRYQKAQEFADSEDFPAAELVWKELEQSAEAAADWRLRSWILLRTGEMWADAREWEKAHTALRSALAAARDPLSEVTVWQAIGDTYWATQSKLDEARRAFESAQRIREKTWGESLSLARGLMSLGAVSVRQGRLGEAADCFERSLKIRERLAPDGLEVARSLNNLGIAAERRGQLDRAKDFYEAALDVRQRRAPDSLVVARSLNSLGNLAFERGELEAAEKYHEKALGIRKQLAPDSLAVAKSLNSLGNLAYERGDLKMAHERYRRAQEVKQRLAPESLAVARGLNNLGSLAYKRGELEQAERYHKQALDIKQRLAADPRELATSLSNLGLVAFQREDLEEAHAYFDQALGRLQQQASESLLVADFLNNLGNVALQSGKLDIADEYFIEALAIRQQQAPDSLVVANSLNNLGLVAYQRGELDDNFYQEALAIARQQAPGGLEVAEILNNLGKLAYRRGELKRVENYYQMALRITRRQAPDSSAEAETLHALATLCRDLDRLRLARDFYQRALGALELQIGKLGGTRDDQAVFRAQRIKYYRDPIELFLELDQSEEAFHTLERSRAQSFLAQLAERDLVFSELPAELDQERRGLAMSYDRIQRQIADLDPKESSEEIKGLRRRLRQLQDKRDDVVDQIRQASPRLAELQYPEPLDLQRAQEGLDPGTVMLSYSVGQEQTDLFAVAHEGELRVEKLPIGEDELRQKVLDFIDRKVPLGKKNALFTPSLVQAGEDLYEILVQPVEDHIEKSRRVLIIADGPLHLLPFAALRRKAGQETGDSKQDSRYLVEWKPLHSVLSATVYAELKETRRHPMNGKRKPSDLTLVAFGDPLYPGKIADDDNVDVYVRAATERGYAFSPLHYSRQEVRQITSLYPPGTVQVYLAEEATEERAKSLVRNTRIVHFAAHGQLDDRFPLNSFLALTIPEKPSEERDNGLLQAWEIFEQVRLEADLVVLSACNTGRGTEVRGEGLIGLTRAFQYAGARSVLATLWSVADDTTAHLMTRFYTHMREGKSKDEALRAAQLELIREPVRVKNERGDLEEVDASSPYHWAAFQILGDWQ